MHVVFLTTTQMKFQKENKGFLSWSTCPTWALDIDRICQDYVKDIMMENSYRMFKKPLKQLHPVAINERRWYTPGQTGLKNLASLDLC